MEVFYRIVSMLGGLSLFLYGMRIMGDGLKGSSGGAMKVALAKVTNKPVMGFLLGLLVTCMIQSSTATIVLTVGLVGAGFLTFRQSIGIVLGANVGTAITAQIIRLMDVQAGAGSILYFFKSDNLAPLALTIGIVMIMFLKSRSADTIGTICMGFGILFVGLMNMSSAVSSMGDSLSGLLTSFEGNYFFGFLSGVVVTGVIQSSSAVIGILQSIASSVGLKFCAVFAVIIGVNIGDCLTTFLVCRIGANREQIRTCLVHIIYNVFAATMIFCTIAVLRTVGVLNDDLWYMTLKSGGIANVHGLFRLVPAVLLLPLSGLFARIAEKISPDLPADAEDAELAAGFRELDNHLLSNPRLALEESGQLIGQMADQAIVNYNAAIEQVFSYDGKRNSRIQQREDLIDRMADASNQYVIAVFPYIKLGTDRRSQVFQVQALACFERIGDLADHIRENTVKLHEAKKEFSDSAKAEMMIATDAVRDILDLSAKAYHENDPAIARQVEPLEEVIDELIDDLKERHVERVTHGLCDVFNGIEFQNILQNLERISDQCSDLAVYLLGKTDDAIRGEEHQYIHDLHQSGDPEYNRLFKEKHDLYYGLLDAVKVNRMEEDQ